MPQNLITMIVFGSLFLFAIMSLTALVAEKLKNAGFVDVIWALGFIPLAIIDAAVGEGLWERKLLLLLLVSVANLRLGGYLLQRAICNHPEEDPRYHVLRQQWGQSAGWKFWLVFLLQGLIMLVLSIPFMLIANNPQPFISPVEWIGIGLWLAGFTGEAMADAQLSQFKINLNNRGKICMDGLWRYSRHPNYFFEWLQWVGLTVITLITPLWPYAMFTPMLMLYLLTKVTGIAATEAQLLKSKGAAYHLYQQTTSSFVPWFPKELN